MDYDLDRNEIRKACRVQVTAEKEVKRTKKLLTNKRKLTKYLIINYAAELLRNQKTKTIITTVISYSITAAIYLQEKLHFTKEETYKIHKVAWWIYRKQSTRPDPARR